MEVYNLAKQYQVIAGEIEWHQTFITMPLIMQHFSSHSFDALSGEKDLW